MDDWTNFNPTATSVNHRAAFYSHHLTSSGRDVDIFLSALMGDKKKSAIELVPIWLSTSDGKDRRKQQNNMELDRFHIEKM